MKNYELKRKEQLPSSSDIESMKTNRKKQHGVEKKIIRTLRLINNINDNMGASQKLNTKSRATKKMTTKKN